MYHSFNEYTEDAYFVPRTGLAVEYIKDGDHIKPLKRRQSSGEDRHRELQKQGIKAGSQLWDSIQKRL